MPGPPPELAPIGGTPHNPAWLWAAISLAFPVSPDAPTQWLYSRRNLHNLPTTGTGAYITYSGRGRILNYQVAPGQVLQFRAQKYGGFQYLDRNGRYQPAPLPLQQHLLLRQIELMRGGRVTGLDLSYLGIQSAAAINRAWSTEELQSALFPTYGPPTAPVEPYTTLEPISSQDVSYTPSPVTYRNASPATVRRALSQYLPENEVNYILENYPRIRNINLFLIDYFRATGRTWRGERYTPTVRSQQTQQSYRSDIQTPFGVWQGTSGDIYSDSYNQGVSGGPAWRVGYRPPPPKKVLTCPEGYTLSEDQTQCVSDTAFDREAPTEGMETTTTKTCVHSAPFCPGGRLGGRNSDGCRGYSPYPCYRDVTITTQNCPEGYTLLDGECLRARASQDPTQTTQTTRKRNRRRNECPPVPVNPCPPPVVSRCPPALPETRCPPPFRDPCPPIGV